MGASSSFVRVDGMQTLKALIAAGKHLAARSASPSDDKAFSEASRLIAEAGVRWLGFGGWGSCQR
jgi:hypothetical protein